MSIFLSVGSIFLFAKHCDILAGAVGSSK